MRGMQYEGLVLWIPCGGCLQASHIRAMSEFRLCITSNCLVILSWFEEQLVLFWGPLAFEGSLQELVTE
jgi:hypothetical protein